ncbi:MAG: D-glycero-beta-D-manno-heptose 1-phosphate adenylyltransferase [Planctomycetota bacterium]|jgi:D-beta-D-heptose 7-phosphate kinase/D-beta-D-heptose 1-phosphate adenosyltransferase
MTRPLSDVLAGLGSPRLLVVGDLILDRYLTGKVDRISPEAPIQVLRVEDETQRLGGGGSVATNVTVLGARTTLVGVVGQDAAADRIAEMAAETGIRLEAVRDPARRTSVKTRHLARSHASAQQVLRVDEETVAPLDAEAEAALRRRIDAALEDVDAVLVSDYGKGVCTEALLAHLVQAGRARGVPVVIDPKGDDFRRYRGATCLTPNRPETHRATGIAIAPGDLAAAERAGAALLADVELDFALITLDREGMYLKVGETPGRRLAVTPREVFDVTGAGDMVLSVLAIALAAGAAPEEAAALANVAAGLEVEHVGVVPVTRAEIAARLGSGLEHGTTKALEGAELQAVLDGHRAAGRSIVFTNGCFDVLHAGHVRYLQAARAEGDVLVVGLNSDDGVRRLKGSDRPVNGLEDRLAVLSALAPVDHIVVFDEDTPRRLIEELRPDVLVKGEDWREKGVVGSDFVTSRGGRVVLLPLLEGRSTTGLIQRMRDGA